MLHIQGPAASRPLFFELMGQIKRVQPLFDMDSESRKAPADGAVIRNVLSGEVDAFEILIQRYENHVFRIVSRHVPSERAAEVAHDAFVKAYLSLRNYRAICPFDHWLARIAVRCCHDYWRALHRRREPVPQPKGCPMDGERRFDLRDMLEWALDHLNADDRMVLTLVYFEEFSVKECAETLRWSESKVKVRALRARRKLKELLAGQVPHGRSDHGTE